MSIINGYYKVMSNIPKMGHLPTPVTGWFSSNAWFVPGWSWPPWPEHSLTSQPASDSVEPAATRMASGA